MARPRVAIVVLNWKALSETLACVERLFAQAYENCEILVVDNGSQDGSAERLRELEPRITLICSDRNLGYAGGSNLGIAQALARKADYVWLLNNDALVEDDTLERLVAAVERDPAIALASPVIYDREGSKRLQFAAARVRWDSREVVQARDLDTAHAWQDAYPDEALVFGTALLIRASAIERIGMLDEALFLYWEDIDYALRAVRAGFRCATVFDATVYHRSTYSDGAVNRPAYYYYYNVRNNVAVWRKYPGGSSGLSDLRRQLDWALHYVMECKKSGDRAGTEACLDGLWAAWQGRSGLWEEGARMPAPLRPLFTTAPYRFSRILTPRPDAAKRRVA